MTSKTLRLSVRSVLLVLSFFGTMVILYVTLAMHSYSRHLDKTSAETRERASRHGLHYVTPIIPETYGPYKHGRKIPDTSEPTLLDKATLVMHEASRIEDSIYSHDDNRAAGLMEYDWQFSDDLNRDANKQDEVKSSLNLNDPYKATEENRNLDEFDEMGSSFGQMSAKENRKVSTSIDEGTSFLNSLTDEKSVGGRYNSKSYINRFTKNMHNTTFDCMTMYAIDPAPPICIFDTSCDRPVSDSIKYYGIWEPRVTLWIRDLLREDASLNLIDVGSNIGQVSLLAASFGRQVVAVDPNLESLKRLRKSAELGRYENNITLLHNVIYDKRGVYPIRINPKNQADVTLMLEQNGEQNESDVTEANSKCISQPQNEVKTILMDDLLQVMTFKRTILNMDIHGLEHFAFRHATELFENISIPYVIMEWGELRKKYFNRFHKSLEKTYVENLIIFMVVRDYKAYSFVTGREIDMQHWAVWPENVLFAHSTINLQTPLILHD